MRDESRFHWETVTVDAGAFGVVQRAATPAGVATAISSGSVGYGSGGPLWLDQFRSKRAPTPVELVEQFKALAYACMSLNFRGVADTPLRLYAVQRAGDKAPRRLYSPVPIAQRRWLGKQRSLATIFNGVNDVHELHEHAFLDALNRPNPFFDGSLMLAFFSACLDCVGRFYLYPERPDPSWASSTWWPLQAQYVMPIKSGGAKILEKYTYFGQDLSPEEIEGGRFLSLRDPYLSGMPPMQAAFEQLGLANYYTAVVENTLKNGARPSVVVGPKDPKGAGWNPDQRARIEADINGKFAQGNQGYIWVVDGTFDVQTLSYPPGDLGGLEINKHQRLLVANCFDVPISLLQTEDSNRAVAEAGEYQHQKRGIRPRCTAIASALTAMAQRVDPRLFFCFDNPVEADEERRAKIVDMGIKNGTLTINRHYENEGLPPVPWGDEPWLPSSLNQPSQITAMQAETLKKMQAKPVDAPAIPPTTTSPVPKPDDDETETESDDEDRKLTTLAVQVLSDVQREMQLDRKRAACRRRALQRRDASKTTRGQTREGQEQGQRHRRDHDDDSGTAVDTRGDAWTDDAGWTVAGGRAEVAPEAVHAVSKATESGARRDSQDGAGAADDDAAGDKRPGSVDSGADADDHGGVGRQPQDELESPEGGDESSERPLGRPEGFEPTPEESDT